MLMVNCQLLIVNGITAFFVNLRNKIYCHPEPCEGSQLFCHPEPREGSQLFCHPEPAKDLYRIILKHKTSMSS